LLLVRTRINNVNRRGKGAYGWVERLCRNGADPDCFAILHDYFVDFGVALEMQVFVDRPRGVDVGVGRVTSSPGLLTYKYEVFDRHHEVDLRRD
jgi:hypothetical protein